MLANSKVVIAKEAYLTIIASCYRYANPGIFKNEWAEVQGALYGHNEGTSCTSKRASRSRT